MEIETLFRVTMAIVLGALIGWERETEGKPAGLRTNALVSLGAATFVLSGLLFFPAVDDVSRLAASIVTGIGFLGAGAIIARRGSVKGLTTSAAIWVSAAVGVSCALGQYLLAVVVAVVAFIVLRSGKFEKEKLGKKQKTRTKIKSKKKK